MTKGESQEKRLQGPILFPHCWLPGNVQEEISAAFPGVMIGKPWFMDDPKDKAEDRRIHIVRPPEAMRPPSDFLKLLGEYRIWMKQNPGFSYFPTEQDESATWEIRRSLLQNDRETHHPVQEEMVLWHLILHLERELEENRIAANEMLLRLKADRSPLAEALGEAAPPHGLLDDLPVDESPSVSEERRLRKVLSAWFGLFGPSVPRDATLLTMTPVVLSFASELFETGPIDPPTREGKLSFHAIHLPGPLSDSPNEKDPVYKGLSGKTLMLATRESCGLKPYVRLGD